MTRDAKEKRNKKLNELEFEIKFNEKRINSLLTELECLAENNKKLVKSFLALVKEAVE